MKILKLSFLAMIIFFLVLFSFVFIFKSHQFKSFSYPKHKIVAHHGGTPENSKVGITDLLTRDIYNIEIDLHFDSQKNALLLSHNELDKNGKYLNIIDLFDELKVSYDLSKLILWLEIKNLEADNQSDILAILNQIKNKYLQNGQFFVESRNYSPLNYLSQNGIPSMYWINTYQKSRIFYLKNILNAFKLMKSNFIGISMPIEKYDQRVVRLFGHLPISLFTINDPQRIDELQNTENVKLIISDL
jgi:hypothetical protein